MNSISKLFSGFLGDNKRNLSWQLYLAVSMGCFLMAFLLFQGELQRQREALAERLAPSVLRFHILAESDRDEDQQVKLEVRSLILDYLKEHLAKDADKAATIACLAQNKDEILALADQHLKEQGFDYQACLEFTNCYFPTRTYGSLVFPCGYYDAARITLGKGSGHNWWCVLYPQFCFVDTACTAVPQESNEKLQEELKEGDYLSLKDSRPKLEFRFLLFPDFNSHSSREKD